ncbi:hypothetical protein YC2023_060933 [Brassica napus]
MPRLPTVGIPRPLKRSMYSISSTFNCRVLSRCIAEKYTTKNIEMTCISSMVDLKAFKTICKIKVKIILENNTVHFFKNVFEGKNKRIFSFPKTTLRGGYVTVYHVLAVKTRVSVESIRTGQTHHSDCTIYYFADDYSATRPLFSTRPTSNGSSSTPTHSALRLEDRMTADLEQVSNVSE